ncbi:hypothetical protein PG993_000742 [Apiospora rasikravindrae]|uniref:CENP-V/GFA domain-containing protein n=1 Tax=Apiospora rasikravindrae TaxID=990691 RepID=A0ABR1U9F1_9PEZI
MSNDHRTASCIYGTINIGITGAPLSRYLCHCSSCQKATGIVHQQCSLQGRCTYSLADHYPYRTPAPSQSQQQVQITFPKGGDDPSTVLKTFEDTQSSDSGTVLLRSFCAIYGTRVTGQRQGSPDRVVIGMGLLDDGGGLEPTSEHFCVNRPAWLGEIQGALRVLRRCRKLQVAAGGQSGKSEW